MTGFSLVVVGLAQNRLVDLYIAQEILKPETHERDGAEFRGREDRQAIPVGHVLVVRDEGFELFVGRGLDLVGSRRIEKKGRDPAALLAHIEAGPGHEIRRRDPPGERERQLLPAQIAFQLGLELGFGQPVHLQHADHRVVVETVGDRIAEGRLQGRLANQGIGGNLEPELVGLGLHCGVGGKPLQNLFAEPELQRLFAGDVRILLLQALQVALEGLGQFANRHLLIAGDDHRRAAAGEYAADAGEGEGDHDEKDDHQCERGFGEGPE